MLRALKTVTQAIDYVIPGLDLTFILALDDPEVTGEEPQPEPFEGVSPQSAVGAQPAKIIKKISDEGAKIYQAWEPCKEDFIICSAPKTGNTWLSAIMHFLRGGAENFQGITQVVPWHQWGYDLDLDILDQNNLHPKLYKSHQLIAAERPGAKYVAIIRHPLSTLKSWHAFRRSKGQDLDKSADELFETVPEAFQTAMGPFASVFEFIEEAYLLRDHPDVLVVVYEDLLRDCKGMLPTIAEFMGLKVNDELLDKVMKHTSKEAMLKSVDKYDENWKTQRLKEVGRAKDTSFKPGRKVTDAKHPEPSEKTFKALEIRLKEKLSQRTPCRTYTDVVQALRQSWQKREDSLGLLNKCHVPIRA